MDNFPVSVANDAPRVASPSLAEPNAAAADVAAHSLVGGMAPGLLAAFTNCTHKTVRAHGALASYYQQSQDPNIHQLDTKGWCVIKRALTPTEVTTHLEMFDKELESLQLKARFANHMASTDSYPSSEHPGSFWSFDTCLLPLQPTAVSIRMLMRRAFANALGCHANELASSFDGVACVPSRFAGKAGPLPIDSNGIVSEMPCLVGDDGTPKGPTHIDQSRFRDATSESHQCYCALTKADLEDFSTILYVPNDDWTLQGVRNLLKTQFPEFYDASHPSNSSNSYKRKRGNTTLGALGDEGHIIPKAHCDFLKAHGVCKVVKPVLAPGDMLVWSSFLFHCGACVKSSTPRGPRLGVISAFAPKSIISENATHVRTKCVGEGFATGQQLLYPSKHKFTVPHCARVTVERLPPPYQWLRQWRQNLKKLRLYVDRQDDSEEMKKYRASIRDLLGLE